MSKKLAKLTLREQAEKALRDMIGSYRFTPGNWINVERLSKDLGVSRTPIWQALKNLEKEGFVTHVPKLGIRMAQMTLEMAHELYVVRGLLEGLAGRLTAQNINNKTVARLVAILKDQKRSVEKEDVVQYSKSDFEFHGLIYDSCGNRLLHDLLENIKNRSRPFVCDITPILPELYQDHLEVVDYLKDHDPVGAERVMRRHNKRMCRQIEKAQKKE